MVELCALCRVERNSSREDMVAAIRGHSFDWNRAWNIDAMVLRIGLGQLVGMLAPMVDKSDATA